MRENFRCCGGVDVPGVGMQHSYDCPKFERQAQAPAPGMTPAALHQYLNNVLLGDILTAARDLAEANIQRTESKSAWFHDRPLLCRECRFGVAHDQRLLHAPGCKTGRMLELIAELLALPGYELNSHGKETVLPEEETQGTVCAGNGISPRRSQALFWSVLRRTLPSRTRRGEEYRGESGEQ